MQRRDFLKYGAFSALTAGGFGSMLARAAGTDYKAAVCVFLSGGCDTNSMIVPIDSVGYAAYANGRKALAIPQSALLPIAPLSGGQYGLHPSMAALQSLFGQRRLAVLANVGTLSRPTTAEQANSGSWPLPDNLLSHNDQQNQWVTLNPANPDTITGWGGRLADALQGNNSAARFPAITSTAGSNLFCDGALGTAAAIDAGGAAGIAGASGSAIDNARMAALQQVLADRGRPQLQGVYAAKAASALDQANTVGAVFNTTLARVFPDTDIGQQLFRVTQMIAARGTLGLSRQVFYVELGGFDTHANQSATLQDLFGQLSQALAVFNNALIDLGVDQNVVTFTHSEFSRTFKPAGDNGNGSDHAWGGHSLILGGPVKGGDLYGTFPRLILSGPDDASDEGRWVPTTSVDQYAATIASWMGVSDVDMTGVLPNLVNFQQKRLGFL